jgi:hypothetical protein
MCHPTFDPSQHIVVASNDGGASTISSGDDVKCFPLNLTMEHDEVENDSSTECSSLLENEESSLTRRVSFPEDNVVTEITYRARTSQQDRKELYYQHDDFKRFKTEFRVMKVDFLRMRNAQQHMLAQKMLLEAQKQEQCFPVVVDKRELSCLDRLRATVATKWSRECGTFWQ